MEFKHPVESLRIEKGSAAWIIGQMWRWEVLGLVATVICGFGVAAMYGEQPTLARVFYAISAILLFVGAVVWEERKNRKNRALDLLFIGFVILLLWAGSETWVEIIDKDPILETSSDMLGATLPLHVSADKPILVILLSTDYKASLLKIKEAANWPITPTPTQPLVQFVTVVKMSNHDKKNVYNVVSKLKIDFMEGAKPGESSGSIISSSSLDWVIDSLSAGDSSSVYMVNESPKIVIVTLPASISAEIQSKVGTHIISTTQRKIDFLEKNNIPITVFPSLYDWSDGTPKPKLPTVPKLPLGPLP